MNMEPSSFNIIVPRPGDAGSFIVNLLSGNADSLSAEETRAIGAGEATEESVTRGYVVDREEENRRYRRTYLDFLDARETDEIQLFYAPHYTCNFSCVYCYQESYQATETRDQGPVITAFFNYIDRTFADRKKYMTLFGGEPLLPSQAARGLTNLFLEQAAKRGLETAVVTNGYTLIEYLPLLADFAIREIQITLDGLEKIHNSRRPLANGGETFDKVVAGIDAALERGLPINLRVIIDKDNIEDLGPLAEFARERGWTKHPRFKTQLGRAYELHTCTRPRAVMYTRASMYASLAEEIKKHPVILDFHKPAFSVARFLFENERLPSPLFDSCPGTKTEWAFDGSGKIYSCTATVGKVGEELGAFYPAVDLDEKKIAHWQERDVTSIPGCAACNVRLACGGGCAAVAKNKNHDTLTPDCRPVEDLLAVGLPLYFDSDQ